MNKITKMNKTLVYYNNIIDNLISFHFRVLLSRIIMLTYKITYFSLGVAFFLPTPN